jgi:hypothetical protein
MKPFSAKPKQVAGSPHNDEGYGPKSHGLANRLVKNIASLEWTRS